MQNAPVTIWLWCELIEYRVYYVFTLDTTLYLPWLGQSAFVVNPCLIGWIYG